MEINNFNMFFEIFELMLLDNAIANEDTQVH